MEGGPLKTARPSTSPWGQSCNQEDSAWPPRSMYLQTLKGSKCGQRSTISRETNRTDDIPGARPATRSEFINKPDFHNIKDIEGAAPAKLHGRFINKPNHFCVKDIPYARSNPRMFATNRVIDPLMPNYKLPSYEAPPPYVPKFIRDNMDCSDVEGAAPARHNRYQMRDTISVADIEGAQPKPMPKQRNQSREVVSLEDASIQRTPPTNPLNPSYRINGVDIHDSQASRPRKMPGKKNYPYYSLLTKDIPGAHSSTSFVKAKKMLDRKGDQLRSPTNTRDIDGASSDTLKRGLQTKRATDPLQPDYVFLDGDKAQKPRKLFSSIPENSFQPREAPARSRSKSVQVELQPKDPQPTRRPSTAALSPNHNVDTAVNRPSTSVQNNERITGPVKNDVRESDVGIKGSYGAADEILIHKLTAKDMPKKPAKTQPRPQKQKQKPVLAAKTAQGKPPKARLSKSYKDDIRSVRELPDTVGDNHNSLCFPRQHIKKA